MKTSSLNFINGLALIIFGTASYFISDMSSLTAFIPVVAGVILIILNNGVKAGKKIPGHIAVILTILVLAGLVKPLLGAYGRGDELILVMVIVMIITGLLALIAFIREFIQVRKAK